MDEPELARFSIPLKSASLELLSILTLTFTDVDINGNEDEPTLIKYFLEGLKNGTVKSLPNFKSSGKIILITSTFGLQLLKCQPQHIIKLTSYRPQYQELPTIIFPAVPLGSSWLKNKPKSITELNEILSNYIDQGLQSHEKMMRPIIPIEYKNLLKPSTTPDMEIENLLKNSKVTQDLSNQIIKIWNETNSDSNQKLEKIKSFIQVIEIHRSITSLLVDHLIEQQRIGDVQSQSSVTSEVPIQMIETSEPHMEIPKHRINTFQEKIPTAYIPKFEENNIIQSLQNLEIMLQTSKIPAKFVISHFLSRAGRLGLLSQASEQQKSNYTEFKAYLLAQLGKDSPSYLAGVLNFTKQSLDQTYSEFKSYLESIYRQLHKIPNITNLTANDKAMLSLHFTKGIRNSDVAKQLQIQNVDYDQIVQRAYAIESATSGLEAKPDEFNMVESLQKMEIKNMINEALINKEENKCQKCGMNHATENCEASNKQKAKFQQRIGNGRNLGYNNFKKEFKIVRWTNPENKNRNRNYNNNDNTNNYNNNNYNKRNYNNNNRNNQYQQHHDRNNRPQNFRNYNNHQQQNQQIQYNNRNQTQQNQSQFQHNTPNNNYYQNNRNDGRNNRNHNNTWQDQRQQQQRHNNSHNRRNDYNDRSNSNYSRQDHHINAITSLSHNEDEEEYDIENNHIHEMHRDPCENGEFNEHINSSKN